MVRVGRSTVDVSLHGHFSHVHGAHDRRHQVRRVGRGVNCLFCLPLYHNENATVFCMTSYRTCYVDVNVLGWVICTHDQLNCRRCVCLPNNSSVMCVSHVIRGSTYVTVICNGYDYCVGCPCTKCDVFLHTCIHRVQNHNNPGCTTRLIWVANVMYNLSHF